jgi:hypothetical protein
MNNVPSLPYDAPILLDEIRFTPNIIIEEEEMGTRGEVGTQVSGHTCSSFFGTHQHFQGQLPAKLRVEIHVESVTRALVDHYHLKGGLSLSCEVTKQAL